MDGTPTKAELVAEINRLSGLLHGAKEANARLIERAERAEQYRDETLGKLLSCQDERAAFRDQRDEARAALAQLVGKS